MASKPKKPVAKPENEIYPRKAVEVYSGETEEKTSRNYAAVVTSPELAAYRVINGVEQKSGFEELIDVPTLMEQLRDQATAVNRGDMAQAEAMLMNQATALQSLFARLAERGMGCEHAPGFEANMKMALRAQSQCRATLETLAAIKNPPIVYARQANVTTGPQQINNGMASPTYAREIKNAQIQLSGKNNELRTDIGAPALAGRTDQEMEALGKIDRSEKQGR